MKIIQDCKLGNEIKRIGHRGFGKTEYNRNDNLYIENTIYSFQQAEKNGFKAVELDIICTKDRHLVVFHDLFVNGKYIYNLTLNEFFEESKRRCRLLKPDLIPINDDKYYPTTLIHILKTFPNMIFNVEIKYSKKNENYIPREDLITLIFHEIKNLNNKIIFSTFDKQIVLLLANRGINTFFLAEEGEINDHLNFINNKYILGLILPEDLYLKNTLAINEYRKKNLNKIFGTYQSQEVPLIFDDFNEPDFKIVD